MMALDMENLAVTSDILAIVAQLFKNSLKDSAINASKNMLSICIASYSDVVMYCRPIASGQARA